MAVDACDSIGVGDVPNVGPSMVYSNGGDSASSRSVGYVSLVWASVSFGVIELLSLLGDRLLRYWR